MHMTTQITSNTRQTLDSITRKIDDLVQEVRTQSGQANEPKAQALFETTAEVLLGLKKAYQDYQQGNEQAWQ